jgi:putative transcriptional regulator
MTAFLRFSARLIVLGVAGILSVAGAAEQFASAFSSVAVAPDARPPSYDLARGMFLVAGRGLVDPNFSESVVLLLEYDAKGALGLVVNRPTQVPLSDLLPDVEELKGREDIVYLGGPVSKNHIVVLMRSDKQPSHAGRVFADTYVSSSMETLRQVLSSGADGGTFHAFAGYAGGGPGQLDQEVSRGDWHVSPGSEAVVFERASEEIWPELIEENSGQWVRDGLPPLRMASVRP